MLTPKAVITDLSFWALREPNYFAWSCVSWRKKETHSVFRRISAQQLSSSYRWCDAVYSHIITFCWLVRPAPCHFNVLIQCLLPIVNSDNSDLLLCFYFSFALILPIFFPPRHFSVITFSPQQSISMVNPITWIKKK